MKQKTSSVYYCSWEAPWPLPSACGPGEGPSRDGFCCTGCGLDTPQPQGTGGQPPALHRLVPVPSSAAS